MHCHGDAQSHKFGQPGAVHRSVRRPAALRPSLDQRGEHDMPNADENLAELRRFTATLGDLGGVERAILTLQKLDELVAPGGGVQALSTFSIGCSSKSG